MKTVKIMVLNLVLGTFLNVSAQAFQGVCASSAEDTQAKVTLIESGSTVQLTLVENRAQNFLEGLRKNSAVTAAALPAVVEKLKRVEVVTLEMNAGNCRIQKLKSPGSAFIVRCSDRDNRMQLVLKNSPEDKSPLTVAVRARGFHFKLSAVTEKTPKMGGEENTMDLVRTTRLSLGSQFILDSSNLAYLDYASTSLEFGARDCLVED